MNGANQPPESWPPGGGPGGCGTAAAAGGGLLVNIPLMIVAINGADNGAPWPGVILSLIMVGVAVYAFRRDGWALRAFALGLMIGWGALSVMSGGQCTGFQRFVL